MNVLCRVIGAAAFLAATAALAAGQSGTSTADPGGPAMLSCSPAPCVLTPTQVSPGPNDVNSAPVAANPSKASDIIVGGNDANCGFEGEYSLGFFLSPDDGSSWNQYCMPGRTFKGQGYRAGEEPILGYDLNGTAYIAGWYFDSNSGSNVALEAFEKSSDGVHWTSPALAVYRKDYFPNCGWLAVDTNVGSPYLNSVYIACSMTGENAAYNQMTVSHSNDGGATWHQVNVAPEQGFPAQDLFHSVAVGRGGAVYLTWEYCHSNVSCFNGPVYMVLSKSSDGGNTWSKPALVAPVTLIYPLPNGPPHSYAANTPAIGVDNSTGPYAGNLYVAMYNWTGTFMQVVVARSTDGGATWSKPVPVAPGFTNDQFLPWLSLSPNGLVGVMWLDRRNDPANVSYQAFAAISADGGLTFQPNVQLTDSFSNPNVGGMGIATYNGAVWNGPNYFLAAWMDTSNGVNTQDFVGGIRLK